MTVLRNSLFFPILFVQPSHSPQQKSHPEFSSKTLTDILQCSVLSIFFSAIARKEINQ